MFELSVLDKGFARLLNISGAIARQEFEQHGGKVTSIKPFDAIDTDPALVARTSFNKGLSERTKEQDEQLVEYLIRNQHTTPLEFTIIWLEVKLPIFVARQIMRHRACSFNEVSGRYVTLPDDWYIPEVVRGKHSGGNKQGSEDNLDLDVQELFKERLQESSKAAYFDYERALERGVCPEQARMFLPLNMYTQFVWKQDLHNLMHFLSLRLDEHAQWETRQFAEAIYQLLKVHLPKSMEWFDEYRRKLTAREKVLLRNLLSDLTYTDGITLDSNLDQTEVLELLTKLAQRNGIKL
jgi:thymidylate synthase (FAD)